MTTYIDALGLLGPPLSREVLELVRATRTLARHANAEICTRAGIDSLERALQALEPFDTVPE